MRIYDSRFERRAEYDLFIAACGYERRSTYLCRVGITSRERLAVVHVGTVGGSFDSNVMEYRAAGWTLTSMDEALAAIDRALRANEYARIGVDVSSMPRASMARFIEYLVRSAVREPVQFLYAPGVFAGSMEVPTQTNALSAGPVSSFFSGELRAPSLPIGVILGLGIEPYRALGLIELLEPARTWIFSGRGSDDRFEKALAVANQALEAVIGSENVFQYDVHSVASIYSAVESLVFSVGLSYRLILAPSGPKVFTLACLLVGASRDATRPAVWRVGGAGASAVVDVVEAGDVVSTTVGFRF